MPITPFLAHQAFEPEAIENMSAVFVAACDALHLKIGDDPATRFVAQKVIELAQRGIRDQDMLRKMTLKEFGLSDESASVSTKSRASNATGYPTPRSYVSLNDGMAENVGPDV
jgi:hypothetical protein